MAKRKRKAAKLAKEPKQKRLTGMEDPKIEALETAAENYAEIRDRRQSLTNDEVDLKAKVLALMKANNKETYIHGEVEIRVVHEDETVKVRIHKDREEGE